MYVYGVDSFNRADLRVDPTTGAPSGRGIPMLEFAERRYGSIPAFWGRYLNDGTLVTGVSAQNHRGSALTRSEADYIFTNAAGRLRILLIHNGMSSSDVIDLRGSSARRRGRRAAREAIEQARHLGVRPETGVRLYLDLERWPVAPELILGWFEGMHGSPFIGLGGLYGRVFPGFVGAEAVTAARRTRPVPWPAAGGEYPWSRALAWTVARYAEERVVPEIVGDILGGRMGIDRNYSCTLMDPHYSIASGTTRTPPSRPTRFTSGMNTGARTVIWQYARDVPVSTRRGMEHMFDMDMATPFAHNEMWAG